MSIRGPQALASLEEAMRDIRREEDEISRRVARTSERITKLREAEAEYFRQLAKLRLDPKIQAELDGEITSAERKARDVLKGHARDVTKAETALKTIEENRAKLIEHRAAALRLLTDKQESLTALTAKLAQQIASDPKFIAQRQETEALDHIAEEALKKTEQAEADREAKGKPYRDDPLFIYLWDAGYGTSTYKASGLTRYLDGLVAKLVGFNKARPNYHMLNELPLRLREHAELQEANVRAAEAEPSSTNRLLPSKISATPPRTLCAASPRAKIRNSSVPQTIWLQRSHARIFALYWQKHAAPARRKTTPSSLRLTKPAPASAKKRLRAKSNALALKLWPSVAVSWKTFSGNSKSSGLMIRGQASAKIASSAICSPNSSRAAFLQLPIGINGGRAKTGRRAANGALATKARAAPAPRTALGAMPVAGQIAVLVVAQSQRANHRPAALAAHGVAALAAALLGAVSRAHVGAAVSAAAVSRQATANPAADLKPGAGSSLPRLGT
jgi:hypothetical protein